MSNKEISNVEEKQPGIDNNNKTLEQQKYSYQRIDVDDSADSFEKIECQYWQSRIETVLDAEKSQRIDDRKAAFVELSKETSPDNNKRLQKTIAAAKSELQKSLKSQGLMEEQRKQRYKAQKAELTHKHYDPLINNFEHVYHSSRPRIDELKAKIRPENEQWANKLSFLDDNNDHVIVFIETDSGKTPIMDIQLNDNRFILTKPAKDGYAAIYRHASNNREYVKDANDVFVSRYVNRYLSAFDKPDEVGLSSRNGPRTVEESSTPENINKSILNHLRAAQQGESRYVSFTTTDNPIFGSTGDDFYDPKKGQVVIDLALIKKENIYDVHSIPAIRKVITTTDLRFDMKYDLNAEEQTPQYEKNAAARDTVRTREILVHHEVPKEAFVSIRKNGKNNGEWQDFQQVYNGQIKGGAQEYFIKQKYNHESTKLYRIKAVKNHLDAVENSTSVNDFQFYMKYISEEFEKLSIQDKKASFITEIAKLNPQVTPNYTDDQYKILAQKILLISIQENQERNELLRIEKETLAKISKSEEIADWKKTLEQSCSDRMKDFFQRKEEVRKQVLIDQKYILDMELATHWTNYTNGNNFSDDEKRIMGITLESMVIDYEKIGVKMSFEQIIDYASGLDHTQFIADLYGNKQTVYIHPSIVQKVDYKNAIIGTTYHNSMQQNILLTDSKSHHHHHAARQQNIGDTSKGICLGLSWIMAVALQKGGQKGVDQLMLNLNQIGSANSSDAENFKNGLAALHTYANQESPYSSSQSSLTDIYTALENATSSKAYKVGTPNHAMTIYVEVDQQGNKQYYIYDPNNKIVGFNKIEGFKFHLDGYFSEHLANRYQIHKEGDILKFEFTPIDVNRIAHLPIKIEDGVFISPDTLWEQSKGMDTVLVDLRKDKTSRIELIKRLTNSGIDSKDLYIAQTMLSGKQDAELFKHAFTDDVYQSAQLDKGKYLVNGASVKKLSNNQYEIEFIDLEKVRSSAANINALTVDNPISQKTITVSNSAAIDRYVSNREKLRLKKNNGLKVDGMDAADLYFTLKGFVDGSGGWSTYDPDKHFHAIVNNTQLVSGLTFTGAQLFNQGYVLAKNLKPEMWGLSGIGKFNNVVGKMGKFLPAIGTALEGVNLYYHIRDANQANDAVMKSVAITQASISSASIAVGATATGAMAVGVIATKLGAAGIAAGAATAGTVAGVAGMVLLPVAIASGMIIHQIQKTYAAEKEAEATFEYLNRQARFYKEASYKSEKGILSPFTNLPIIKIDLVANTATYGSDYINKVRFTSGISGVMVEHILDNTDQMELVLPYIPEAELEYTYGNFNTGGHGKYQSDTLKSWDTDGVMYSLHDKGASLYSSMESWSGGMSGTSGGISVKGTVTTYAIGLKAPNIKDTQVEVVLDKQSRVLHMSNLPDKYKNKLIYKMIGGGGNTTVALKAGVTINLSESVDLRGANVDPSKKSNWILDARGLEASDIRIEQGKLVISGLTVNIDPSIVGGKIVVIKKNGDICRIDPSKQKPILTQTNGWTGNVPAGYEVERYVAIKDYMHQGVNVGNAFYDASTQKVVFTTTNESHQPTELIEALRGVVFKISEYNHCGYKYYGHSNQTYDSLRTSYLCETGMLKQVHELLCPINSGPSYMSSLTGQSALNEEVKQWAHDALALHETLKQIVSNKSERITTERRDYGSWHSYDHKYFKEYIPLDRLLTESQIQSIANLESRLNVLTHKVSNIGLLQNAQLGAVVGDDVYWYNTQEGLIWRTNRLTGKVEAQYGFPSEDVLFERGNDISLKYWAITDIKFQQSNDQVQVRLDIQAKKGDIYAKLDYHIDKDVIQLVGVKRGDAALPNLEDTNVQRFTFNNVRTIEKREAPLISYYDENASVDRFYWLDNNNRKIIPKLPNDQLNEHFVLLSAMTKENGDEVFYFFDPLKNKLYEQKNLSPASIIATALVSLLGGIINRLMGVSEGGLGFFDANASKDIVQLFPSMKFASVSQKAGMLHLITEEGASILWEIPNGSLSVSTKGKATLVGLNQAWLDAKANNLSTSISSLIKDNNLSHGEVIALPDNNGLRRWYHVDLKQTIEAFGGTKDKHPAYIGTKINSDGSKNVHITTSEMHYLHDYDKDGKPIINGAGSNVGYYNGDLKAVHTQRVGETLTLVGSNGDDALVPRLVQGVNSAVMSGGEGKDTYNLTEDSKKQLKHIIINNFSIDRKTDVLKLANTDKAMLSRGANDNLNQSITKNDLLITQEGNLVVLKNVFAEEKADYNHMELHANNQKYNVAHLVSRFEQDARSGFHNTLYGLSSFDTLQ